MSIVNWSSNQSLCGNISDKLPTNRSASFYNKSSNFDDVLRDEEDHEQYFDRGIWKNEAYLEEEHVANVTEVVLMTKIEYIKWCKVFL